MLEEEGKGEEERKQVSQPAMPDVYFLIYLMNQREINREKKKQKNKKYFNQNNFLSLSLFLWH